MIVTCLTDEITKKKPKNDLVLPHVCGEAARVASQTDSGRLQSRGSLVWSQKAIGIRISAIVPRPGRGAISRPVRVDPVQITPDDNVCVNSTETRFSAKTSASRYQAWDRKGFPAHDADNNKDRAVQRLRTGSRHRLPIRWRVSAKPILGGLHHEYSVEKRAA